jgi:biopolymer transport protein ExbB
MTRNAMEVAVSKRRWVLVLMAGLSMLPGAAHGWWNAEWAARKPVRIDTSAAGANVTEPIGTTPVLVRLHAGNFRFDAAKDDGSDLRFIAGDDKTPLKFHIEKYDGLLGEALVWVSVPDLNPAAKTELWLYYKNPKATAAGEAKSTYDSATALVYHFGEVGQPPRDSSTWGNHATTAAPLADGALIGRGLKLDGTATVSIPAATSMAWTTGARMTWSVWLKPADANATAVLFNRRDNGSSFAIGLDGGKPYVDVDGGSGIRRALAPAALPANGWHHLAVTAGDAIGLYVDGAQVAKLAAPLPALNTASVLGGASAPAAAADAQPRPRVPAGARAAQGSSAPGFKGELDELEISNTERPAGFIQIAALAQGADPGKLLIAGQDEESGGGGGGGYFAVIIKSVTPDGWVVIALLAIMAVVSWLVMVSKASYLSAIERANDRFLEQFHRASSDLVQLVRSGETLGAEKHLRHSPLRRLFQIAADEIKKRSDGEQPLSAEAIEAVRASLDAGLVRENQTLTKRMVLLTIAISGGPFLGLLGTVVGVMITFAAIAAAGDVNVNAIAPGIAAALVATVAGLGVAIPALFGYNWLLTRVKEAGATMQVFVDEIVAKTAEAYSPSDRHRQGARPTIVAAE